VKKKQLIRLQLDVTEQQLNKMLLDVTAKKLNQKFSLNFWRKTARKGDRKSGITKASARKIIKTLKGFYDDTRRLRMQLLRIKDKVEHQKKVKAANGQR